AEDQAPAPGTRDPGRGPDAIRQGGKHRHLQEQLDHGARSCRRRRRSASEPRGDGTAGEVQKVSYKGCSGRSLQEAPRRAGGPPPAGPAGRVAANPPLRPIGDSAVWLIVKGYRTARPETLGVHRKNTINPGRQTCGVVRKPIGRRPAGSPKVHTESPPRFTS